MNATRCNGCGRSDVATSTFRCHWPDGRVTVEHHCGACRFTWHRQLRALGARLEEVIGDDDGPSVRGEGT